MKPNWGDKRWNKGRQPTKFYFTYQDIADIVGLDVETVRKYSRDGAFDPNDLKSVVKFIESR